MIRSPQDERIQRELDTIAKADRLMCKWTAEGNKLSEAGNQKEAERAFRKAAYWLSVYNRRTGG